MNIHVLALVLLGPVAAAYDFVTNPAAPPHIFASQLPYYMGPAPYPPPLPPPRPRPRKHVNQMG